MTPWEKNNNTSQLSGLRLVRGSVANHATKRFSFPSPPKSPYLLITFFPPSPSHLLLLFFPFFPLPEAFLLLHAINYYYQIYYQPYTLSFIRSLTTTNTLTTVITAALHNPFSPYCHPFLLLTLGSVLSSLFTSFSCNLHTSSSSPLLFSPSSLDLTPSSRFFITSLFLHFYVLFVRLLTSSI